MKYYFTFGSGHINGCGTNLKNRYTEVIADSVQEAREQMHVRRGNDYAFVYDCPKKAGVNRWNLQRFPLDHLTKQP